MDPSAWMDAKQLLKIFFRWNACPATPEEISSLDTTIGTLKKVPGLIGFTNWKMSYGPSYLFSTRHLISLQMWDVK